MRHENFSESVLCRYSASRIFASVWRPVYLQAPAARASYRDCFRETAACSREQYAVTAYASNVRGMSTAHCAMTLRAPGPLDTCGPQELRGRVSANRCESSRSALSAQRSALSARTQLVFSHDTLRRFLALEYTLVLSVPPRILNSLPFQPSHDLSSPSPPLSSVFDGAHPLASESPTPLKHAQVHSTKHSLTSRESVRASSFRIELCVHCLLSICLLLISDQGTRGPDTTTTPGFVCRSCLATGSSTVSVSILSRHRNIK